MQSSLSWYFSVFLQFNLAPVQSLICSGWSELDASSKKPLNNPAKERNEAKAGVGEDNFHNALMSMQVVSMRLSETREYLSNNRRVWAV